ncbi:GxxExxY protein [Cnuella takakiae]|uniref:GxxExxY protein n=2 Tax=Cnuella takakiae TaxID=1302690 RepID=A0A1M4X6Y2_9BACT|nr:GxxExxY protein [Cnuella takakiae]
MKVHNHFGCGFPEAIYRKSLLIELAQTGLNFKSEVEKDIYYQAQWIGKRRLDVLVEQKVLVELKAVGEIDKTACNQVLNYLNIFKIEVGLLLDFGADSLQFKRFVYSERNLRNQ